MTSTTTILSAGSSPFDLDDRSRLPRLVDGRGPSPRRSRQRRCLPSSLLAAPRPPARRARRPKVAETRPQIPPTPRDRALAGSSRTPSQRKDKTVIKPSWLGVLGKYGCDLVFPHFKKKKKKKEKNRRRRRRGPGAAPQAPGGSAGGAEGAPEARATTTRLLKLAYGHGYMYLLSLVGSDSLTVNVPDLSSSGRRSTRPAATRAVPLWAAGSPARAPRAGSVGLGEGDFAEASRSEPTTKRKISPAPPRSARPGMGTGTEESPVAAGAWLEMGRRRRAARSRPPSAGSRLLARPVLGGGADWQAHWWARWPVQA